MFTPCLCASVVEVCLLFPPCPALLEILGKPVSHTLYYVTLVRRVSEYMTFMLIDHQFRLNAQGLQGVPELIRLRRRAFTVTVTHQHQSWSFGVFDKSNGRAASVDLRIVIDRGPEERNQPEINLVFPIVALEVCQSSAGHGGGKAIGLRDRPHRHIPAITPAGNAQAVLVHGSFLEHLVHAGHDVTEIAITKILHVGAGKRLTLAKAAARIGKEHKGTSGRKRDAETVRPRPSGM